MDIADYISESHPQTALDFIDRLEARCLKIGTLPESYRLRPKLGNNVRSVVFSSYLIFYRAFDESVRIERIIHGSRDLTQVDFG